MLSEHEREAFESLSQILLHNTYSELVTEVQQLHKYSCRESVCTAQSMNLNKTAVTWKCETVALD